MHLCTTRVMFGPVYNLNNLSDGPLIMLAYAHNLPVLKLSFAFLGHCSF